MSVYGDDKPPRISRGMYQRFAIAAVLIVVLSAGAVASAGLLEVNDLVTTFRQHAKPIPNIAGALDNVSTGKPQTILVLGSDRRFVDIQQDNPARSDTMMLVRLDPSKEATAVMSIPRDLKVEIPMKQGIVTDKINAAYAFGGPALSVRTVKLLLNIPINHVVNVNFGGFQRAVNRLGCVYVDVDRKYFNDNNPPNGSPYDYATIDVPAGYQRLCGQDSLDFVRYRHFDDDFVRSARQQDFLRQAKDQIGLSRIFGDRKELLRIFGRYTDTDIKSSHAILQLLKLVLESSGHPIREVRFRGDTGPDYVTITPQNLAISKYQFLSAQASNGPRETAGSDADNDQPAAGAKRRATTRGTGTLPAGVIDAQLQGEDYVATASTRLGFPLYYPTAKLAVGVYQGDGPRVYTLADRSGKQYQAYRIVVRAGLNGQYYGVQGMTWRSPPILDDPSDEETMAGRKYQLFYDGNRIRLIAWRTPRAVYWVSNSLSKTLTNAQMRAIARSLRRVGET